MISRARTLTAAAVLGTALPVLIGAGALAAHAAGPGARPANPTHSTPSAKVPSSAALAKLKGYQQVSAAFTDTAQAQTFGSASCPSGTRLVGGGAVIAGTSLSENLNASAPSTDGLTWFAYVDNANTAAGSFTVYADCVKKVASYSVVESAGVDNPAGTQSSASVACPTGTVVLGGGGNNGSSDTAVLLNTSIPSGNGWRTDVNNNGGGGDTIFTFAICGQRPGGYAVVTGPGSTYGASTQGSDSATCPTGTDALSGGAYSSSGSTSVDLNSTYPFGSTQWRAYINDTATVGSTVTAYAVCAKA